MDKITYVSEDDQRLLGRLLARQEALSRAAAELGSIVQEHLVGVYGVNPGDQVMIETDWSIVRVAQANEDVIVGEGDGE